MTTQSLPTVAALGTAGRSLEKGSKKEFKLSIRFNSTRCKAYGAKWHQSEDLVIPENISLYFLPPYSPELNPIGQILGYLKSNFLSGRIFKNMTDILDYGVRAWRELSQGENRKRLHKPQNLIESQELFSELKKAVPALADYFESLLLTKKIGHEKSAFLNLRKQYQCL